MGIKEDWVCVRVRAFACWYEWLLLKRCVCVYCTLKNQMAASHRRPEHEHRALELEEMLLTVNCVVYLCYENKEQNAQSAFLCC